MSDHKSELVTLQIPANMTAIQLSGLCHVLRCRLMQEAEGSLYIETDRGTRIELTTDTVSP